VYSTHLCVIAADAFEDDKFIVGKLRPELQHDFPSEVVQVQFRNDSAGEQKHTIHSTVRHGGPLFNYKLFHPPYLMHAPSATGWVFSCVCRRRQRVYCVERECTYGLTASLSFKKEVSPIDSRIWG
jgi:hypothetical protein